MACVVQTMEAVSGKDGSVLWSFGSSKSDARNDKLNVYVGQFVYDLDSDSVADLVVAHGGISFVEAGKSCCGRYTLYLYQA